MPTDAKAGCLYPLTIARALMEARTLGFDNCLLFDMLGNVAELRYREYFSRQRRRDPHAEANGSFLARRDAAARAFRCCAQDGKGGARGDAQLRRLDQAGESSSSGIMAR